jgi:hypothetical protein
VAGRTLLDAQADYTAVHAAYLKALLSEEYESGGRRNRRSKSQELYAQMKELDAEVKLLSRGGIRIRGLTPT